ncbi:hypothetical protein ACFL3S_06195, partial [Gemmatimonadota bacterium]
MMPVPGVRLIEVAARLVPHRRRKDWCQEWEAETTYAWQRLERIGGGSSLDRLRLRTRVLSCFI